MPPRAKTVHPPTTPPTATEELRQRLVDLRDRLTAELDVCSPAYCAGIARQLQAVVSQLATLPDPTAPPDMLDDLIKKRRDRRAAAGLPEPPRRTPRGAA